MGRRLVTFSLACVLAAVALMAHVVVTAEPAGRAVDGNAAPPAVASPYNAVQQIQNPAPSLPVEPQPLPVASPYNAAVQQIQNTGPPPSPDKPVAGQTVQDPNQPPPMSQPRTDAAPPVAAEPKPKDGPLGMEPPVFQTPTMPAPNINTQNLKIGSRSSIPYDFTALNLKSGETVYLLTGGVKLLATRNDKTKAVLDIEADQVVIWKKPAKKRDVPETTDPWKEPPPPAEDENEVYLTGNVVVRYGNATGKLNPEGSPLEEKTLRANRVYYDMTNNKAIALDADLETIRPAYLMNVPSHIVTKELWQLSQQEYLTHRTVAAASKLPADPGLDLRMRELRITEEKNQVERTIFGFPFIDRNTGEDVVGTVRRFYTQNTFLDLAGLPIFYFPVLSGNADDPAGPFNNFFFRQDRVFGTAFLTTWSVLELIGVKQLPGERFNLMVDYLSERGPALGTAYDLSWPRMFGYDAPFNTHVLAYGVYDSGHDILGGLRSNNWDPPGYRGRITWRHQQEYDDFYYQGQVSYLSDTNFLEQYYKYVFDMGPNQETFSYLKYQVGNGAASILAEPNLDRPWVTETKWLPKLDGNWLGQSILDTFTYNARGSAAYANLQVYNLPPSQLPSTVPPATVPTEPQSVTSRFDFMQDLSMPFSLGPFKIVPYVVGDAAFYSQDVNGDPIGRIYGAYGTRASMPLSRQFDDVQSDLLNLQSINHKITFAANYYNAYTNVHYNQLPQLDRLDDDATQEAIRDITPWQTIYVPGPAGQALFNSPLYNPQLYAIRQLVDTRADTLDDINVLQGEIRQRWQTKRGYPGLEHTVDYVTLNLSASYFPQYNRDNFGHPISFLEYLATWAIGDRNGITSTGWFDPYPMGTHYWNMNAYYNRPDGLNMNLAFRWYDPIGSRQLSGSVSYMFSPKYSVSFYSAYDFGLSQDQATGMILNRIGTDLTWSFGFSYNAIINNFAFNFMVTPNLMARTGQTSFLNQGSSQQGRN